MKSVFKNHLLQSFKEYSIKEFEEIDINSFIDYLIDHHLFDETTIRRYTIIKEFEKEYPKHDGHKTQTVYTIANKFNLSDRTIWTVLKDHLNRFDNRK